MLLKDDNNNLVWKPTLKQEKFLAVPLTVKEAFYAGAVNAGKALALDTLVPTPTGTKEFGNVHTGDFLYSPDGFITKVVAETEVFPNDDCYELVLDSGIRIKANSSHLWNVTKAGVGTNRANPELVLTTKELAESDYSYRIHVAEPLHGYHCQVPIAPYTLGAWLGDGNSYDGKVTSTDYEIIDRIGLDGFDVTEHGYNYSFQVHGLAKLLRENNLVQNKHIPEVYYTAFSSIRFELLRGLLDTDGTIDDQGRIELSLSNEFLATDALRLIRSLGIKASITKNASWLNGENKKDRYRIKFTTEHEVFYLKRKADKLDRTGKKDARGNYHYIREVNKIESVPTKCIQVMGGLFLVTEGYVTTHNSDVLLMYPIVHGWHNHPQFKGLFLRRTMPELRNEIIPRAKDYFRPFGAKFNATNNLFTFPSGALIFMGHCENEEDVHNYDSMQPNYVAFDELTSFTEWIYTYITIERVRVNKNLEHELPAIVRSGSNPGNIGHQFVYKRFIKPCPEGGKILVGRGGIKRVFIQATIDDNPHASEQYKRELDALPDAERRAKKLGDWSAYEGQVFDEFRDKHYPGEPENALHVIPEFAIPDWWPRICAIDWGFSAMCSVGWAAISPNKKIYVYRHQMFYSQKIAEWVPQVGYYAARDKPLDIVICWSANQNRGEPHTIYEQVSELLEFPVRLGEKNRLSGKMLLHEYLRWKPKPAPPVEVSYFNQELANWIRRNKGEAEYKLYLASFNAEVEETDIPRLLFLDTPDVKVITDALKNCIYEKADKSGKKKEDVAEFSGDDPYDMMRMLVHAADNFFGLAQSEQSRLEKQSMVINYLQETKDMTGYYHKMRVIESENRITPVRRFHRGR